MPRAGLDPASVTAAGAALADEIGFAELTMGGVAERVGVKTPSLYKHVSGQDDLTRRIALLALEEAGAAIGEAVRGCSGRAALGAAAHALRDYVLAHPGRYAATLGIAPAGADDPMIAAAIRSIEPLRAVVADYGVPADQVTHALRAVRAAFHGFATLQAVSGFQWPEDVDASFEWLVDLVDAGLRAAAGRRED